jgi:hypothetical protein
MMEEKMAQKTMIIFLLTLMIGLSGCSKTSQTEKSSLEIYENIVTEGDIRDVTSYSGPIERSCNENMKKGVHLSFGTEGYVATRGEGDRIFIVHIEHLFPSEEELVQDMQGKQTIPGLGTHAWYDETKDHNSIIFYDLDKDIIVEM